MKTDTKTNQKPVNGERTLQSVLRGFNALEIIAASPGGLPLKDIAAQLGTKPPATHILLNTLVAGGYLVRQPRDVRYRLGEAAFRLADRYLENILLQGAEQIVREVARQLPQATVIYAEPRNHEVTVLFRMSPDRPGMIQTPRERNMSPYSSATGLACLTFCAPEERAAIFEQHDFLQEGIATWNKQAKMEDFFGKARKLGYAMPIFKGHPLRTIAAPVFNRRGQLAAALGASMPADEFAAIEQKIIAAVTNTAHQLSTPHPTKKKDCKNVENLVSGFSGTARRTTKQFDDFRHSAK